MSQRAVLIRLAIVAACGLVLPIPSAGATPPEGVSSDRSAQAHR